MPNRFISDPDTFMMLFLLENWVFRFFLNFTPNSNLRFCGSMAEIEGSQPRVPGIHCIARFSILSQVFPCLIADSGGTIYLVLILLGDVYEATGCGFLGVWYIRTVGSDVSIPPPFVCQSWKFMFLSHHFQNQSWTRFCEQGKGL